MLELTPNVKDIIEKSIPDPKIGNIIKKFGFIYVNGHRFKFENKVSPAFTIGFYVLGTHLGTIYISDLILSNFDEKELEWIILHELAHIALNHLPRTLLADLISVIGAEYLAEEFDMPYSFGELIVKFVRSLITLYSGGITRVHELAADEWATARQGTNVYAISALRKLSGGDIDQVSHVATGYVFEVPAITIRQRIEALQRIYYYSSYPSRARFHKFFLLLFLSPILNIFFENLLFRAYICHLLTISCY